MALIQSTLIWVVYAVVLVLVVAIASIFVYLYQTPKERSPTVTIVSIFTLTALLATVLLLPVDVALVSSTTSSRHGIRKDWATQNRVDSIKLTLRIVYYTLFSLDALLCLVVVPFTYFWHEEYDEVASEEGQQTIGSRFWGAFKYTIAFIALVVIIFLVGFFVPIAKDRKGGHYDLDFFKHIIEDQNRELATYLIQLIYAANIDLIHRWGACLDIRSWIAHYNWHFDICPLHCRGIRSTPCCIDQVGTSNIGTDPKRKYRL